MVRVLVLARLTALLLFTFPAHAHFERLYPVAGLELVQNAPPVDEDGCIALAEKMDVKEKAKQKPTPKETEVFEQCVEWFNCEKASGDDAGWAAASRTHEKIVRFVLKTCTGYDPKPLTPGEKFMREKP